METRYPLIDADGKPIGLVRSTKVSGRYAPEVYRLTSGPTYFHVQPEFERIAVRVDKATVMSATEAVALYYRENVCPPDMLLEDIATLEAELKDLCEDGQGGIWSLGDLARLAMTVPGGAAPLDSARVRETVNPIELHTLIDATGNCIGTVHCVFKGEGDGPTLYRLSGRPTYLRFDGKHARGIVVRLEETTSLSAVAAVELMQRCYNYVPQEMLQDVAAIQRQPTARWLMRGGIPLRDIANAGLTDELSLDEATGVASVEPAEAPPGEAEIGVGVVSPTVELSLTKRIEPNGIVSGTPAALRAFDSLDEAAGKSATSESGAEPAPSGNALVKSDKRLWTVAAAEPIVDKYLKKHRYATASEIERETGIPDSTVCKTTSWIERPYKRKSGKQKRRHRGGVSLELVKIVAAKVAGSNADYDELIERCQSDPAFRKEMERELHECKEHEALRETGRRVEA